MAAMFRLWPKDRLRLVAGMLGPQLQSLVTWGVANGQLGGEIVDEAVALASGDSVTQCQCLLPVQMGAATRLDPCA